MTEVTRVPLQPVAKGSLTKVWLGLIALILFGAGLAWASVPKSASVETLVEGTGPAPKVGEVIFVKYVGKLASGEEFDRSTPSPIPPELFPDGTPFLLEADQMIPGFFTGLLKTKKGGKYVIEIPAEQGYGAEPPPGSEIPANSDLIFEVEVVEIMAREDAERKVQMIQQMMQQQQGGAPGGPGGPGGPTGPGGPPTGGPGTPPPAPPSGQ